MFAMQMGDEERKRKMGVTVRGNAIAAIGTDKCE
jgi:hypothetical protein